MEIQIVILMGVAGVGKTTIGHCLARKLGWPLLEADRFHRPEHIAKMRAGIPLTDEDRRPWLRALRAAIETQLKTGHCAVLACSALKEDYRSKLVRPGEPIALVYLGAPATLLRQRLTERVGHYMKQSMLESQLQNLEPPKGSEIGRFATFLELEAAGPPKTLVAKILRKLGSCNELEDDSFGRDEV